MDNAPLVVFGQRRNSCQQSAARADSCPGTAVIIRLQLTREYAKSIVRILSVVREIPLQNCPPVFGSIRLPHFSQLKSLWQIDVLNQCVSIRRRKKYVELVRSSVWRVERLAAKN